MANVPQTRYRDEMEARGHLHILREVEDGGTYHVMGRGVRRMKIIDDEGDWQIFRMILLRQMERHPFIIHSYCMMTNHYHILLSTHPGTSLSALMHDIQYLYARNYNHRHGYSGHLFEKRFTSCIVRDDIYFSECSRYIHLNPVKALMVRDPSEYAYSSYSSIVNDAEDDLLSRERLLSLFHNSPLQYRIYVEGKISHAEQELLIREAMHEDENWLPW